MEYQFPGTFRALTPVPELNLTTTPVVEEPGWGTSIGAAFRREYLPIAAFNYQQREYTELEEVEDPTFNGWDFILKNKEEFVDISETMLSSPDWITRAKNENHLRRIADLMREEREMINEAEANGFVPYLLGSIGAIALDPLSWAIIGLSNKAAKAAQVTTRLGKAAVYGVYGSLEQSAAEYILQQGQSQRTLLESASAIALSGAISAGIGAIFKPKVAGKPGINEVLTENSAERGVVIPDTMDGREAYGTYFRTAGAVDQTIKGGDLPAAVSKHDLPYASIGKAINATTPIGRALNIASDWMHIFSKTAKEGHAAADIAVRRHYGLMEDIVETHMVSEKNMEGIATVPASALKDEYRRLAINTYVNLHQAYSNTMKTLGQGTGPLSRSWWAGIKKQQYMEDILRYRFAKEANDGADPSDFVLSGNGAQMPADLKAKYISGIRKGSDYVTQFYKKMEIDELDYGLLSPEDAKMFYTTHKYKVEALRSDPEGFKNLLYRRFMKEPNREWLQTEYGTDWKSMDLEMRKSVVEHWQDVSRKDIMARAQNNIVAAAQALSDAKLSIKEIRKLKTFSNVRKFAAKLKVVAQATQQRRAVYEKLALQHQRRVAKLEVFQSRLQSWLDAPLPLRGKDAVNRVARIKRLQGLVEGTQRWVNENDKRLAKVRGELNDVEFRIQRAEAHLQSARTQAGIARRSLRATIARASAAKQAGKKAERQLAKVIKAKKLSESVDLVYESIMDHKKAPYGILPVDVVEQSGFMKRRQIDWGDMLKETELLRFFETNAENLLFGYAEDMGSRLALTKKFGDESLKDVLTGKNGVFRGYEEAISAAKTVGNTNLAEFLEKSYRTARIDLVAMRDMFLGRYNVGENGHTALSYWSKQARNFNFNRMMGKVWFSSFTDPVTMAAAMDVGLIKFMKGVVKSAKDFDKIPSVELKRLIDGMEISMAYNREMVTYGANEAGTYGHGYGTGRTLKFSQGLDRVQTDIGNLMNKANTMSWWNKTMRHIGGSLFVEKAYQELPQYAAGKLKPYATGKWARLGISQDMAGRISTLMNQMSNTVNDMKYPNLDAWAGVDPDALGVFERAMHSLLNEGLIMPGLGDLPLFMSNPLGKLLFQFQSFNYATISRYVRPLYQRGQLDSPIPPIANALSGILVGYLGYTGRVLLAGASMDRWENQHKELREKGDVGLIWEAVLRSPLVGPAGLWMEASGKAFGGPINEYLENRYLNGIIPGSGGRMAERSALATLLGPTFGTFEQTVSTGSNLIKGEGGKAAQGFLRLQPLSSLWHLQGSVAWAQRTGVLPKLVE